MNRFVRHIVLVAFLLMFVTRMVAQIDTEFWFAVPYLTNAHSSSLADRKGKICVTSFAETAHITISQPAITNPSDPKYFVPITYTLPPYTSHDFDVMQGSINRANQTGTGRFGIHVEADSAVSVYFAQVNENSEIYTLKGRNALGTAFLVPQQSRYGNAFSANPTIEIVATENNTTVNIVTPVTTMNNKNGTTINITLNRGETYTVRSTNSSTANHLGGTIITSDKPIAVNTTDDSVASTGQDLLGEQLVPTSISGDEYIAISNGSPNEYLYLFALPNTPITYTINGGAPQTLAAGRSTMITLSQTATYVQADNQFVAFQVTADGGELGATVLPRLDCTGSYEVAYKKRFSSQILTLLVKTPYTGSFLINGNPVTLNFKQVPNTGWSYCRLTTPSFDSNGIIRVTNTDALFHASIMDFGGGTCSYGYFSGYNHVELLPYASGTVFNQGETLQLGVQNAQLFDNIKWIFPNGNTVTGADVTVPITSTADGGTYFVTATSIEGCPLLQDSVPVVIQVMREPPSDEYQCPEPVVIEESVVLCDTLLPYHWRGKTITTAGTYRDTTFIELPYVIFCEEYIYVLHLSVNHCERDPSLRVRLLTDHIEVCDGDESFVLDYELQEGSAHMCIITMTDDSGTRSYTEIVPQGSTSAPSQVSLLVHLPEDMSIRLSPLRPVTIQVSFADTANHLYWPAVGKQELPVQVLYDPEKVFAQKWDNVLAIFSPQYSGYQLVLDTRYQWYRNGAPIPGETFSYLHLPTSTFNLSDYYQVEVTRLQDGVTLMTCPYFPHEPAYKRAPGMYDVMGRPLQAAPRSGFYIHVTEDKIEKVIVK